MNKEKELFNSQYYGQKILVTSKSAFAIQPNTAAFWNMAYDTSYLKLRDITSISDDEYLNFISILDPNLSDEEKEEGVQFKQEIADAFINDKYNVASNNIQPVYYLNAYNYLKSISIAIPYKNLSVTDLIDIGYITID